MVKRCVRLAGLQPNTKCEPRRVGIATGACHFIVPRARPLPSCEKTANPILGEWVASNRACKKRAPGMCGWDFPISHMDAGDEFAPGAIENLWFPNCRAGKVQLLLVITHDGQNLISGLKRKTIFRGNNPVTPRRGRRRNSE